MTTNTDEEQDETYTCHQCGDYFDDDSYGEWWGSEMWICDECAGSDDEED